MPTIAQYSTYAELALASYAESLEGATSTQRIDQYRAAGMADVEAQSFDQQWNVLSQPAGDPNGFSAVLLQNVQTGEKVLALRGSDNTVDYVTDVVDILGGQLRDMPQYASLEAYYQHLVSTGKLGSTEQITVTGHSLGGFLAQGFTANHSEVVLATYTYNAPGFGGAIQEVVEFFGLVDASAASAKIINVRASDGFSATAGLGQMLGSVQQVNIEPGGITASHSIITLSDALAVQAMYSRLQPSLTASQASDAFAASGLGSRRLEDALDTLRTVFVGSASNDVNRTPTGDRERLYFNLHTLQSNTSFTTLSGHIRLELGRSFFASQAQANTQTALAYRYSLLELLPIAVVADTEAANQTLYGPYTQRLSIYNETTGQGEWTRQWLADRALMLNAIVGRNLRNDSDSVIANGTAVPPNTALLDIVTGRTILSGAVNPNQRAQIVFGGDGNDPIDGYGRADRLYGGAGNDVLNGQGGSDRLEGNAEDDSLLGGSGTDTLLGGADDDTLDGGTDNDQLLGGQGTDTYKFTGTWGRDTVIDSDGLGRIEVDGVALSGGKKDPGGVYHSANGLIEYTFDAGRTTLTIRIQGRADDIVIRNWRSDVSGPQLGLTFDEVPATFDTTLSLAGSTAPEALVIPNKGYASATITGLDGDDVLQAIGISASAPLAGGTPPALNWADDRDLLDGGIGADTLYGGDGRDTIIGGAGSDVVWGGIMMAEPVSGDAFLPSDGFDEFSPAGFVEWNFGSSRRAEDSNVVDAGDGDDTVHAGWGDDVVRGGLGLDLLIGQAGSDVLYGDGGADRLWGDWSVVYQVVSDPVNPLNNVYDMAWTPAYLHGDDTLDGGDDNDQIVGMGADDMLFGGAGNDTLFGDDDDLLRTPLAVHGDDYLDGGDGADVGLGGVGDDELYGGTGDDSLWGDTDQTAVSASLHGTDYLDGEAGADQLIGGGADDVVYGGAGNDRMWGDDRQSVVPVAYHGNDLLDGEDGDDSMMGGGGDDVLYGGAGNDSMMGDDVESEVAVSAHGSDYLDGGLGNDTLYGGGGDDQLTGGEGDDMLYGDVDSDGTTQVGVDWLEGGSGNDVLRGGGGGDYLLGDSGQDVLYGNAGADTLEGGEGTDYLDGGAGDDTYLFGAGDSHQDAVGNTEVVFDSGGANAIEFATGVDAAALTVTADASGSFLVIGYGAADRIGVNGGLAGSVQTYRFAGAANLSWSELIGRFADAALNGQDGAGLALRMGGRNNDSLAATGGFATISGGLGDDTLTATGGGNAYRYSLGDGRDTITDIGGVNPETGAPLPASRIVFGSGISAADVSLSFDGTLVLKVGANAGDEIRITGFDAANALVAPSIDRFEFSDGTMLTQAQLVARGFDMAGTTGNDTLAGTSVVDRFDGGQGNDLQRGGGGGDSYAWGMGAGQDVIDDGDTSASGAIDSLLVGAGLASLDLVLNRIGNDLLVRERNGTDSVTVVNHFAGAGLETVAFNDGTTWNAAAIAAHVTNELTAGADNFTGSAGDDVIDGLVGNDTVRGGGGNDVIDGNLGNDSLFGDAGSDQLAGGAGNDALVGGAGGDTYLFGVGGGIDTIDDQGTDGAIDVLRFEPAVVPTGLKLSVSGASIALAIQGTSDKITIAGPDEAAGKKIERIEFSDGTVWTESQWAQRALQDSATAGNDVINGFAATADNIAGLDGNDSLTGNAGNDTLDGGYGNDSLIGGAGADLLVAGDGTDALGGDDGNDTLDGGAGTDYMVGGNGDDRLIDGENMNGNAGNDTYAMTTWQAATITEDDLSGAGADTLVLPVASSSIVVQRGFNSSTGGWDDLILQSTGRSGDILLPLYFYAQNNSFKVETIQFGDGISWVPADVIARDARSKTTEASDFNVIGFRWGDVLNGQGGDDGINGLQGDDQIDGGNGSDRLTGSTGNDQLAGGNGNDSLVGDDTQSVSAGDGNDTLNGGAGADSLYGAGGNDTYVFDRSSDVDSIFEAAGTDRILLGAGIAQANVTLFKNGNDLILALDAGTTQLTVAGHFASAVNQIESIEFADGTIWNAAAIVSRTVAGAPNAMTGTAGNDTFVVDDVGDTISEAANQGIDTVQASVNYSLGANLENLVQTGYLNIAGTGNALDNQLTGNIGHNQLAGGAGLDTIVGGGGDDTISGNMLSAMSDGLSDSLVGGAGNDSYYVYLGDADIVVEQPDEGIDTVNLYANSFQYTLPANVENLNEYTVSYSFGVTLTGNALSNLITAHPNYGGVVLDGGAGADTMVGSNVDSTFVVDNVADVVVAGFGSVDTVKSSVDWSLAADQEHLQLMSGAAYGRGNQGNNKLTGNGQSDVLEGLAGNDTFFADVGTSYFAAGPDTLIGGSGDDQYFVDWMATSHDTVVELANEGVDTVSINGVVRTYSLAEYLNVENLTLQSNSGASGLTGDGAANRLVGNGSANLIVGADGDDDLVDGDSSSSGSSDTLMGGNGADRLTSLYGQDWLDGGAGNDTLAWASNASSGTLVFGSGAGNDVVNAAGVNGGRRILLAAGTQPSDVAFGRSGADLVMTLGPASDVLTVVGFFVDPTSWSASGNVGSFQFTDGASLSATAVAQRAATGSANAATPSSDVLLGGALDDTMAGLAGDDQLLGGAGNDDLAGNSGNDSLYGGDGSDLYRYSSGDGVDVIGESSGAADRVVFAAGIVPAGVSVSRSGDDLLLALSSPGDLLIVRSFFLLAGNEIETVEFADGTIWNNATLKDLAGKIIGTSSPDVLLGTSAADRMFGLNGNDQLSGLDGDDTIDGGAGNDTMSGGFGNDTFIVDSAGDATTEAAGGGIDTVLSTITWTLAANVEQLTLTGTAAINGTGNALDNVIIGNSANNTLSGGIGADTLAGGAGSDVYVVDSAGDVVTELGGEGTDLVQSGVNYTLAAEVENLTLTGTSGLSGTGNALDNVITGNSGANTLNGAAGNDRLDGGTGNDTMAGGTGNDTYVVNVATDVVNELANEGIDTIESSVTLTFTNANVENLTLTGSTAINGTGNALDNVLTGNSATNTLSGGAGNDTYVVGTGDIISEAAGAGTDTVLSSISWTTLAANVENITLTGSGAINATGNTLNNVLTGNTGNNTLDGSAGIDTLIGGAGNDTYVVDSASDVVTELAAEGTDLVQSSVTIVALAANVENLILTGTSGLSGTGNALDNVITGNSGANTLNGAAGNDRLDGGAGNDTMVGGTGNDTYVVNVATDVVNELANEGIDTIESSVTLTLTNANVENLTLTGSTAINGTGNALDNVLTGNSGANSLTGAAGNDRLDGGTGNDTMAGGTGDDTYVVNVSTDVINELTNEGIDTVESSVTLTLTNANVENLTLTGSTAINGTGNALDNVLIGNGGINALQGAAGNDTYDGGAGNDSLTDNSTTSNDVYRWGLGYGTDTITDSGGTDRVDLGAGIAAGQLVFSHVGNNLELTVAGASDKLIVANWYLNTANRIETFRLSDGSTVSPAQIPLSVVNRQLAAAGAEADPSLQRQRIMPVRPPAVASTTQPLRAMHSLPWQLWALSDVMLPELPEPATASSAPAAIKVNQAHILVTAMAMFDASTHAALADERQAILPVQRLEPMWMAPTAM